MCPIIALVLGREIRWTDAVLTNTKPRRDTCGALSCVGVTYGG